jgi:uncharacterized protein with ParB-like and HNH nuclease domain
MEKQTLSTLLNGKIFSIPDYQRGYSWEEKQLQDFIDDIDALITDPHIRFHYTGTVVTYAPPEKSNVIYNRKTVNKVDVVDGQQRLTTVSLYLSVIIRALVDNGFDEYSNDIPEFLYQGEMCKLKLNNETEELFYQLLKDGETRIAPETSHQKRLCNALDYFKNHIENQLKRKDKGINTIKEIFTAITGKLVFTYYTIEEECEIGMTFELMNSRGKGLSVLELLKNYFMHWIARNGTDELQRKDLTYTVNSAWKDTYTNIGRSTGSETQALRVSWILYCHYLPKYWSGYEGFKSNKYMPLRDFSLKNIEETKNFLIKFSEGLANISYHYSIVVTPKNNNIPNDEFTWLSKIHNTGNISNFLPLIIAARIKCENNNEYIDLLKSIECYAYRIFLFEEKRSNAGKSNFYRCGIEVFNNLTTISDITDSIYKLIRYYSPEESFEKYVLEPGDWYICKHLLKYTLYEYELYLLKEEGKNKCPVINWNELNTSSTLEHILPQTIDKNSQWKKDWDNKDQKLFLHDIGNIVLTQNNSNYKNFDFDRKKGHAGISPSYSNSDIRQERKLAVHEKWDVDNLKKRRKELENWILNRWSTPQNLGEFDVTNISDIDDDKDLDMVD